MGKLVVEMVRATEIDFVCHWFGGTYRTLVGLDLSEKTQRSVVVAAHRVGEVVGLDLLEKTQRSVGVAAHCVGEVVGLDLLEKTQRSVDVAAHCVGEVVGLDLLEKTQRSVGVAAHRVGEVVGKRVHNTIQNHVVDGYRPCSLNFRKITDMLRWQ